MTGNSASSQDESTDKSTINYLTIHLQAPERDSVTVYFYKILRISDGTAEGLMTLIEDQFRKDNLTEYFKSNLVGFGSGK